MYIPSLRARSVGTIRRRREYATFGQKSNGDERADINALQVSSGLRSRQAGDNSHEHLFCIGTSYMLDKISDIHTAFENTLRVGEPSALLVGHDEQPA